MDNHIWDDLKKILAVKTKANVYRMWIEPLEVLEADQNHLVILAPNTFTRSLVSARFLKEIEEAYRYLTGLGSDETLEIEVLDPSVESVKLPTDPVTVREERSEFQTEPSPEKTHEHPEEEENPMKLEPSYTFDRFVSGNNSAFALATAKAVAKNPATLYNPLFIWGGVGLGKTHLMQAIAHEILKTNPNAKILYLTSEKFTSELISKIQFSKMDEFQKKYRSVDVLLMDDIQFIAGKKSTQEEFFNTFNELKEQKKQIILTSDRPPWEIEMLEDRLKSRVGSGITTEIAAPEYEVRVAILKQELKHHEIEVPMEVLDYLAERYTTDVRKMKSSLFNMTARAKLMERKVNLAFAEDTIKVYDGGEPMTPLTIPMIQGFVARQYDLDVAEMLGKSRMAKVTNPRQIAMYLTRELMPDLSFPKIADAYMRDHSTVIHAIGKIQGMMKRDRNFREEISGYMERLKNREF